MTLKASVIIPAKNAADTLGECLDALTHQEGMALGQDYEVIVVDDGSTDATVEVANRYPVQVISQENAGPAKARNNGARQAKGDLIAFTDADCVPVGDWLKKLLEPFEDAQVMGAKGAYETKETDIVPRFVQVEYAYKYERMKSFQTIDFIDTYSAAYRRQVFIDNGGFEEAFPVPSVEDQELSFRLALKGCIMKFQPEALVYHRHDLSVSEYMRRKFNIGYWKAFMLRWMPRKILADTHTPLSQRLEIVLFPAIILAGVFSLFYPVFGWVFLILSAGFVLNMLPFLFFISNQDPDVIFSAVPLILVRTISLGMGLAVGFLFPSKKARALYK